MIEKDVREKIIALIQREVVPAIGCTEPMAVSLCVARATEALGGVPEKIEVLLSANMLKNAMGVGIPGTGMVGLPIAIALGALIGKSEYGLEVLRDVTPEAVEQGKQWLEKSKLDIKLKENCPDKLYIEVNAWTPVNTSKAIIAHDHTHFVHISRTSKHGDEEVILDLPLKQSAEEEGEMDELTLRMVYDFATTAPLEELEFIKEARRLNENAAQEALKGNYGHSLGKTLSRPLGRGIMGDSIFSHILSATSSACDARMAGAPIPVMSNSGSGNQGISCTMPVVVFAEENQYRRGTHPCPHPFAPHRHLHQAVARQAVGPLWLCGGFHRLLVWHHLSHGWQLRPSVLLREKHDC